MKNYIILGILVLCGLVAFLLTQKHYEQMARDLKLRGRKVDVIVAKKHIIAGEKLSAEKGAGNVALVDYPERLLRKQGDGKYDVLTSKDWDMVRKQDWRMAVSLEKMEPLRWKHFEVSDRKLRRTSSDHTSPKSQLNQPIEQHGDR